MRYLITCRRSAFATASILECTLSNLRETDLGGTNAELRVLLFDRPYGAEIDPAQHASVVARLRGERQPV